ncbi:Tumor protein p53-inducible nuclear protein 1 [Lucilia cuprina]|nr:Tumor protein p53-inducible nuclear protein 1 [Lucilia cuprina]
MAAMAAVKRLIAQKADGGITRSLYVVTATTPQSDDKPLAINTANGLEAITKMDESWFVTPPPCFTSIGPINMETSPYENLLIEHPSMSVYHSIKTAQEAATESFIKLDIGVNDMAEKQKANETTPKKNPQAVQSRSSGSAYRLDRQSVAQLKQELMARNVQNIQTKKERKDICRTAIKRANKVRDVQSRNHTQRRADRQHSKIFSNANNNRKSNCC